MLELGKLHALRNEGLFGISEHWLDIWIVKVGVQIEQLDGEEPNSVCLPALNHRIVAILRQIYFLEYSHDPANLLALFRQAALAEYQSPA